MVCSLVDGEEKSHANDGERFLNRWPRLLWTLVGLPFSGNYRKSAIIHDALYMAQIVTRQQADFLFLHEVKDEELSWSKRDLIYISVRIFGAIE